MSLLALPLEIVHLIVDEHRDDIQTLLSCSLVSVHWLQASRSHILSRVNINLNVPRAKTFLGLLESPSCTFINCARKIYIFPYTEAGSEPFTQQAIVQLGKLSNVRSLCVQYHPNEVQKSTLDALATSFSKITALVLRSHFHSLCDAMEFAALFNQLEELNFDPYFLDAGAPPPSDFSPPPNLCSLHLHSLLQHKRWFPNSRGDRISTFAFSGLRKKQDVATLNGILRILSSNLRDLTLRFKTTEDLAVDLGHNTGLRRLTFAYPMRVVSTLSSLHAAPYLEYIACETYIFLSHIDTLIGLDELLADRATFPSLKTLATSTSSPHPHMPLCDALGVTIRDIRSTTG
ncbi:hypothetical protein C8J57DRAFT_1296516 [Mycena rebaudengoi]|nr:hypothetical protein C8J57DRAFT_1296516 [Mycena rebaudengoi]